MERPLLCGVCHDLGLARVTLAQPPGRPDATAAVLAALANAEITAEHVSASVGPGGRREIAVLVAAAQAAVALAAVERLAAAGDLGAVRCERALARVSVVGFGLASAPGLVAGALASLTGAGVGVLMTSTANTRVTAVVNERDVLAAVGALCRAFGVRAGEPDLVPTGVPTAVPAELRAVS